MQAKHVSSRLAGLSKRMRRCITVAVPAAFLLSGAMLSGPALGDCVAYSDYMHLRGALKTSGSKAVRVAGTYAYLADYQDLRVVDISNPDSLTSLGQVDLPGFVLGLALSGNFAYVGVVASSGLQVIDISNPQAPAVVGHLDANNGVSGVVVSGSYAYITTGSGLEIIDVSTPSAPVRVRTVAVPGANAVAVAGNYAYATSQLGLTVVDISIPANAGIVGGVDIPGINGSITVSGDYAYVGDSFSPSGTGDDLQVVDVSDPSAPVVVDIVPTKSLEVSVVGGFLYQVGGTGFRTYDLSNPALPELLGNINTPAGANGGAVSGGLAYIATYSGLQVIDLTNPASVVPLGTAELPGGLNNFPSFSGIAVSGGLAYVSGGLYFTVLDVSTPGAPVVLGGLGSEGDSFGDFAQSMNLVYVIKDDTLNVVDVANPASPSVIGKIELPDADRFSKMAISGSVACVTGSTGLCVIDLSSQASPAIIGHLDLPSIPLDVDIAGDYAYVVEGFAGLQIVDMTTPASPAVVGSLATQFSPSLVVVAGNHAYVSGGYVFATVDVSAPAQPILLGSISLPGDARSLAVGDGLAYVADNFAGLQILDVSNPLAPSIVGNTANPDVLEQRETVGVAVSGTFVYLTDGALFSIAPTQCSTGVPVTLLSFQALPTSGGISVTWALSDALDLAGSYIHRSTNRDGGYRRLASRPIVFPEPYRLLDTDVTAGTTYFYRLETVDRTGKSEFHGPVSARMGEGPVGNRLGLSRPNPFREGTTEIDFDLGRPARATVTVYDASGRRVRRVMDETLDAGHHVVSWDGRDDGGALAASGIYFYRLDTQGFTESHRLVRAP